MDVDCEGCAGCCVDWHALAPDVEPPSRSGARRPLDDAVNFVPLERDEVRGLLEAGLGDALTPRLWAVDPEAAERGADSEGHERGVDDGDAAPARGRPAEAAGGTVSVDGYELAAVAGRPVFYLGLRKPVKPVAPFDRDSAVWLPTCAFLDPETLQCRVHGDEVYPDACAAYPGNNLLLEQDTECERVEAAFGGERLLDDEPPTDLPGVGLGPQALGAKLFAYPEPGDLEGRVERLARGDATDEDRAQFVAVGAASSPGTLAVSGDHRERALERVREADSWVGRAVEGWSERAGDVGSEASADPALAERVEEERGAPPTPGWD